MEHETGSNKEFTMHFREHHRKAACWAFACLLGLLVTVRPVSADTSLQRELIESEQHETIEPEKRKGVLGKALYYNKSFRNKRTSSGALSNPEKLTAAHPTLPLGSRVKVLNLDNQKSVIVTVNDRCRNHGYELIDLSHAAARELGFLGRGTAMVRITKLDEAAQ